MSGEIPSVHIEKGGMVRPAEHSLGGETSFKPVAPPRRSNLGWSEAPPPDPHPKPGPSSPLRAELLAATSTLIDRMRSSSPSSPSVTTSYAQGVDRVLSPDATSSQSSSSNLSSLRRSISSDQSTIRSRIRERARSTIHKKRDTVQLAKRLQRTQTPQHSAKAQAIEYTIEEDSVAIDESISKSIERASKLVKESNRALAPDLIQARFFHGIPEIKASFPPTRSDNNALISPTVCYARAKPNSAANREKFTAQLTFPRKNIIGIGRRLDAEDPAARLNSTMLATPMPAKMLEHFAEWASSHMQIATQAEYQSCVVERTKTNLYPNGEDERDTGASIPLVYRKAERWDEGSGGGLSDVEEWTSKPEYRYSRLSFDINRVEFDHHWLFSVEDSLAYCVQELFNEHNRIFERLLHNMRQYLVHNAGREVGEEGHKEHDEYAPTREQISTEINELMRAGSQLESAWKRLEQWRTRTGLLSTNIQLEKANKLIGEDIVEGMLAGSPGADVPEEFIEIFRSPVYSLKNNKKTAANPNEALSKEQQAIRKQDSDREAAVKACQLEAQIYFNNTVLVATTEKVELQPRSFIASFATIYNLRVFERVEELKLTIRERFGKGAWQTLADIYVPIPDMSPVDGGGLLALEFASNARRGSYKNSMGAGMPGESPFIHGRVYCSAQWTMAATSYPMLRDQAVADTSMADSEPFKLFHPQIGLTTPESAFNQRIEYNGRHPARNHSLLEAVIEERGDSELELDGEHLLKNTRQLGITSSLDAQREIGHADAVALRRHLIENFALWKRLKTRSELVREEPLPIIGIALGSLFMPRDLSRKLKPQRSMTSVRSVQMRQARVRLLINIQQAQNLPLRANNEATEVLVEARFQNQRAQTMVVGGRHAIWQETLHLNVFRRGYPSASARVAVDYDFRHLMDRLELHLYDQLVAPLKADDREINTIHQQIERRWLGGVKIPFATIYTLGKIDGLLAIETPLLQTGYNPANKQATLKVLVTVDPPFAEPVIEPHHGFPLGEQDHNIVRKALEWEKRMKARFADRRFKALANNSRGDRILTSRFLGKIVPPARVRELAITHSTKAAAALALRFVSSIPFITDPIMFPGQCDVWCTADEVLRMGCADEEEHAILYVCWLLAMDIPSVLLLGTAYPEGPKAAYVLIQFNSMNSWLVNPASGCRYSPDDPTCPLISVGTIVTPNNVYGNIQRVNHPSQLEFDLRKRTHWEPLFFENRSDIGTVQPEHVHYEEVSEDLLLELRSNLEREIRLKIDEARPYAIPQWNFLVSRTLREILYDIGLAEERGVIDSQDTVNTQLLLDAESRLHQLSHGYRVSATAFRRPYTAKEELVADVLKLGLHLDANEDIQFAMALNMHPIFNRIILCSIAIAVLRPPVM